MNILKKPIISEKSMGLRAQNYYTFEVAKEANKNQIKEAVERLFKVNVTEVKTILMKGKVKKTGRRRRKVLPKSWKKAIVKLKAGEKIEFSELGK